MEQLILDFLGPSAGIPMTIAAMLVWWQRRSVRKWHLVALIVLTAIGLVGFYAALIAGMAQSQKLPAPVIMALFHVTAWLSVGCATGFSAGFLILRFGRFDQLDIKD